MATTTSNNPESLSLLERTRALIQAERSLTATLEKVEPWLASKVYQKSSTAHRSTIVRPIPRTMEEVNQVLAVGRNYASRTSAPAGWNPAAPLVGFSTPNPLPNQLRCGAMAALQLDRAVETDKKRKRQLEQEELQAAKKQAEEEAAQQSQADKEKKQQMQQQQQKQQQQQQQQARRVAIHANQAAATADADMNLSDRSSSSEEESSEEED